LIWGPAADWLCVSAVNIVSGILCAGMYGMNDKVGFIRLGIMGCLMALNLKRAGRLFVHARCQAAMEPLIGGGYPCLRAEPR